MFALFFSGYTVVGVPNEAFRTGWLSLRWLTTAAFVGVGYFGTGARLRKASLVRNHQSPTDFITDRFRSQILRYTAVTLQIFPSIIYLTAQCTAIRTTFNSIFRLDPDNYGPVIGICIIILLFEYMGGLSCVALTDSIQGFIMVLSFLIIPIVIKKNFGGWYDLDWQVYPRQDFYQTPNASEQWLFWQFTVVNFCFFSLPHFLQRTYAASSLKALKFGFNVVALGPWLTMITGTFIGTVGVQLLADAGIENPASPYSAILTVLMDLGGFPYVMAVITFTASLAAIMSTADSLLIAISHVLTAEIIYPIWPDASPARITMFGRLSSFVSISVALAISILGGKNLSDLAAIQFGLSLQLLPVFMVGLYANKTFDCHPYSLAFGAWSGFVTTFAIHYSYMKGYNAEVDGPPFNSGVMGVFLNFASIMLVEGFRWTATKSKGEDVVSESAADEVEMFVGEDLGKSPEIKPHMHQPKWDVPKLKRFGDVAFTSDLMWKCMEGLREPFCEPWFGLLMFLFSLTMTPLVGGKSPPLNEDGMLAYPPNVFNGIPAWTLNTIFFTLFMTGVMFWAINVMPDDYPEPKEDEDVDPNTVSLTRAELGQRSSYDGINASARLRRSSVVRASQIKSSIIKSAIVEDEAAEEMAEKEE
mmetsp:Transcript_6592/g.18409  ORF Transcript_6592/g.18409 Transcript_6592/m.18409 type:complete len:644 (+) Transcript_6592:3-1934(+)